MARPTHVRIDAAALLHNLNVVRRFAGSAHIIAMVKANAYGCGLAAVVPVLEQGVSLFGVACLEEALAIRALGVTRDCLLIQGVFSEDDIPIVVKHRFQCVLHTRDQIQWFLSRPLEQAIRVWVKVNTGMNRLGFDPHEVHEVITALGACPWIDPDIGLMTHLACADEPEHPANGKQLDCFRALDLPAVPLTRSIANSAALMALPDSCADAVRPGIMLYGVSPFSNQTGQQAGLVPVMRFVSAISAIHHYPAGVFVGYGGTFKTARPSVIAVIPAGYGDGYPRHIAPDTPVWVNGPIVPGVGRLSMDRLTVDVTGCEGIAVGDEVELWGQHIPVETIASQAGTLAYELLCQVSTGYARYG